MTASPTEASECPSPAVKPELSARGCCSFGNLPAMMAKKITLSMPSTISMAVNVNKPNRIPNNPFVCGVVDLISRSASTGATALDCSPKSEDPAI